MWPMQESNHLMTLQLRHDLQGVLAADARTPVPLQRCVVSAVSRRFGIRPSRMNPDICTICDDV